MRANIRDPQNADRGNAQGGEEFCPNPNRRNNENRHSHYQAF